MTLQTAITKAIEGGFKPFPNADITARENDIKVYLNDPNDTKYYLTIRDLVLMPLFWQSLGKSEGWNKEVSISYYGYCKDGECNTNGEIDEAYRLTEYQYTMHRFIDHLIEGHGVESFFETL